MSWFDKFGKLTDAYSDMDDDYYEPGMDDEPLFETVEDEPRNPRPARREKPKKEKRRRASIFSDEEDEELFDEPAPVQPAPQPKPAGRFGSRREKVVDFKTTAGNGSIREFVIFQPLRFENGTEIVDHMRCGRIVLVNEELMTTEEARRITDSLSGAAYALDGKLLRVGSLRAVVFTPRGVALLSDQMDELESSVLQF